MPVHTSTHTKDNPSKISNFAFEILPSYSKRRNTPTEWKSSFDETIRHTSKWFILTLKRQTLELLNVKCVTYAQTYP